MNPVLSDILKSLGPRLSTDLAEYLVKTRKLSSAAARQRVSRGDAKVKRLAHLPFARKARFLYHQDDYASPLYWERLFAAIFASGGPYSRALASVQARLAIPTGQFGAVGGAPIAQKKQLAAHAVLERLIAANVLVQHPLPGLGECVMMKKTYEYHQADLSELASVVRARLVAEDILLGTLREWSRRLALVSYNTVRTRAPQMPRMGTFEWDMVAPSYMSSMTTRLKEGKLKSGWVVCDVLLADGVQLKHVEPFLHKVRSTEALKNIGRTMYIFVAHGYDAEAFKALRSSGIVPATPASLFGVDAAEGFRDLADTLKKAAKGIVDPEKFERIFSSLGKLEGALGNMRGAFFELLVAEVVRKTASAQVRVNKICKGEDGDAEVDVFYINEGIEARLIECKGVAPGSTVDDEEIELWLTTRIKRVRHHLRVLGWKVPKPRFELWTSGRLSEQAMQRFEKTRIANIEKFDLVIVDGLNLRQPVKAVNDLPLMKTFEQHFLPQAAA